MGVSREMVRESQTVRCATTHLWYEHLDVGDVDLVDESVDALPQRFPDQPLKLCARSILLFSALHHGSHTMRWDIGPSALGVDHLLHLSSQIQGGLGFISSRELRRREREAHLTFPFAQSLSIFVVHPRDGKQLGGGGSGGGGCVE